MTDNAPTVLAVTFSDGTTCDVALTDLDCQWFALCDRQATTTIPHPIVGDVPCCARCEQWTRDIRSDKDTP